MPTIPTSTCCTSTSARTPVTAAWLDALDPTLRAGLLRQQRVARLTTDGALGSRLQDAGLDSAHRIAAMPEHRFLREHGALFDGDQDSARQLHQRLRHPRGHAPTPTCMPCWTRRTSAACRPTMSPDVSAYFSQIPSYQDLFGSLNYCKCRECASIFSPAAYFLDMMRITDDYITDPNSTKPSGNIPQGYLLSQRRPDLFDLALNCANTDTPIATVDIVNQVLARHISQAQPQAQARRRPAPRPASRWRPRPRPTRTVTPACGSF